MSLRKIFAAKLTGLMEESFSLDTQVKVSKAADISQSSVGRFLKGSVSPTLDNLEAIANVFGVPPSFLVQGPSELVNTNSIDYRIKNLPPVDRRKVIEYVDLILQSQNKKASPIARTRTRVLSEADAAAVAADAGKALPIKDGVKKSERRTMPQSRRSAG